MNEKGRMDDLASLFLPDLLHPLSSTDNGQSKPDESFFYQDRRSSLSTPLSSGLGMYMAFTDEPDQGEAAEVPLNVHQAYANNAYPQNPPQPQYIPTNYPNMPINIHNNIHANYQPHRFLPFPDQDMGHILHYSDFVPAEAGLLQPMRHHQLRQRLPVQPAFSPSTVIGQFEGLAWQGNDDFTSQLYSGHVTPDLQALGQRAIRNDQLLRPDIDLANARKDRPKPKKPLPEKVRTTAAKAAAPKINLDYSQEALSRLSVLAPNGELSCTLTDAAGRAVPCKFSASLDGRLLTNDQDNFNHISFYTGAPSQDEVFLPRVISCYRRNFVSVHFELSVDNFSGGLFVHGSPVNRLRIDIGAITEGTSPSAVPFMIMNDKDKGAKDKDKKDPSRPKITPVYLLDKSNPVELSSLASSNAFCIKKLQFKSATSNSSNLNYQTYYRLTSQLVAETDAGPKVLHDLIGASMTVRGRNPSFYQERKDIRIKTNSIDNIPLGDLESKLRDPLEPTSEPTIDSAQTVVKSEESEGIKTVDEEAEYESGDKASDSNDKDADGDSAAPNSPLEHSQSQSLSQPTQASQQQIMANVDEFIASKTKDSENNYHYFPILSVYYLPPINVVYFPHGVHQDKAADESNVSRESESKVSTPGVSTTMERKRGSKVYFRS